MLRSISVHKSQHIGSFDIKTLISSKFFSFCYKNIHFKRHRICQSFTYSTKTPSTMSQHNAPFPDLNLISLSASDLQSLLTKNKTNSVDLVQQCLHFIKMNDKQGLNLRGMISIVEEMKLFKRASILDDERRNGQIRGPLHGIPVTLKV